ncbi:hypothetical protein HNR29_007470 [Rhizobium leguminosarum]|nr:hypothetical protein [Rhizobium leguminosarum]
MDGLILWQLRLYGVEKTDELLMPVTLHVSTDHRAVEDIEGGKQGGGAMALVIVSHRAGAPFLQGKSWLRPVECLDLALLIDGQDNGCQCRVNFPQKEVRTNSWTAYAAIPRLRRYSVGLTPPSEIFIRC